MHEVVFFHSKVWSFRYFAVLLRTQTDNVVSIKGCFTLSGEAEIIPIEPDADNAAEGKESLSDCVLLGHAYTQHHVRLVGKVSVSFNQCFLVPLSCLIIYLYFLKQ